LRLSVSLHRWTTSGSRPGAMEVDHGTITVRLYRDTLGVGRTHERLGAVRIRRTAGAAANHRL
jgi:hypothetical protein